MDLDFEALNILSVPYKSWCATPKYVEFFIFKFKICIFSGSKSCTDSYIADCTWTPHCAGV